MQQTDSGLVIKAMLESLTRTPRYLVSNNSALRLDDRAMFLNSYRLHHYFVSVWPLASPPRNSLSGARTQSTLAAMTSETRRTVTFCTASWYSTVW